ncbi:MAG TPA: hypothetical protein VFH48_22530 [Chloroflexota bacterium]|nr:hypothetical protein [Chloroflexota bacterium]
MGLLEIAVLLAWLAIVLCLWAVYQLVAQNGRLLLRMEALERHLGDMVGLSPAVYAGQLASADETADESHSDESGGPPGISPGTVLHEFELPDLDGRQHLRSDWQGQCLLMIFVSPYCRSSRALLADLVALRSSAPASWPLPVLVSTGSIEENRRLSRSRAGASWRGVETICSRTPSTTRSGCSGSTST